MQIHISRGENQSGPFTLEQVQDYLAQGILLPDDLAWHDGLEGWIPLPQVMDSVATPAASPPPEPVAATPEPIEPEPSTVEALEAAPAKAGGNKKLLIGIGAGMAVLAIAAAVWFFVIREKDSGTGNQQVVRQPQPKPTNNAPVPTPPKPNPNEPTNSPPPLVIPGTRSVEMSAFTMTSWRSALPEKIGGTTSKSERCSFFTTSLGSTIHPWIFIFPMPA